MKNKKGSTIVWAVMLIMVLMVIVGASLSFAYMSYNQSVKNRNKTQVELIANSAIKSLVSVIEDGKVDIPTTTEAKKIDSIKLLDATNNEVQTNFGIISDIYVRRKEENGKVALAYLTANYADEKYTIYGYLVYSNNAWKCVQYDTNGNRTIKIENSNNGNTGGNTGDNTGGNTGDNTGDNSGGSTDVSSSIIEKMKKNFSNLLEAYYGKSMDKTKFNEWLYQECQNRGVTPFTNENFNGENVYWHQYNEIYAKLYNNTMLEQLNDEIVQKAKEINSSIPDNIYLHFLIIPNTNGKYCIVGNNNSNYDEDNNIYMIIYNDKFYIKKQGNDGNYEWKINQGESGLQGMLNSDEWQLLK